MTNPKISWRSTAKIYGYHIMMVHKLTSLVILVSFGLAWLISHYYHFSLWLFLQKPVVYISAIITLLLIQLFPINLYVLRNKTLQHQFKHITMNLIEKKENES